jgi:short-subunit dehydrogenase
LGRSMAIASARSGAKVVLSARDEAKLQAVKQASGVMTVCGVYLG